ncbi:inositol monophosphatase family protein [Pseudoroseomonas wenyumeiae]
MAEALGRPLEVHYKPTAETEHSLKDPVSEVDRAVEAALRAEIEARFPDHQILGEEFANPPTTPAASPGPSTRWMAPPISSMVFRFSAAPSAW